MSNPYVKQSVRALRIKRARSLRRDMTPPERLLWSRLRDRRLAGLRFRRQQPIGCYVVDFYCANAKLAIELDGQSHHTSAARDRKRDDWMRAEGIETLRIGVPVLMRDVNGALAVIERAALRLITERTTRSHPPHPSPLPQGEREHETPHASNMLAAIHISPIEPHARAADSGEH